MSKKTVSHIFHKSFRAFSVEKNSRKTKRSHKNCESENEKSDNPEIVPQVRNAADILKKSGNESGDFFGFSADHGVNRKTDYFRTNKFAERRKK